MQYFWSKIVKLRAVTDLVLEGEDCQHPEDLVVIVANLQSIAHLAHQRQSCFIDLTSSHPGKWKIFSVLWSCFGLQTKLEGIWFGSKRECRFLMNTNTKDLIANHYDPTPPNYHLQHINSISSVVIASGQSLNHSYIVDVIHPSFRISS